MSQSALDAALVFLTHHLEIISDPWWIIGGTAFEIMTSPDPIISDIDVLISNADAQRLIDLNGWVNQAEGGSTLFRSTCFLKTSYDGIPIELMSGLEVRQGVRWSPIAPQTRRKVAFGGIEIYLPEANELARIFETCGRPKDMLRAQYLRTTG